MSLSGHKIARLEQNDVARNQISARMIVQVAAAPQTNGRARELPQCRHRLFCAIGCDGFEFGKNRAGLELMPRSTRIRNGRDGAG